MPLDWTANTVPFYQTNHHHSTSIAYILSGAVIPIWPIIQHELDNSKYIQIVRCIVGKGAEQERVVGLEIKEGVQNNIVQAIHEFKTLHQLNDADDEALARRLQAEEEGQGDDEGEDEEGGGGKAKAASSASAAAAPSGKGGHKAAANISVGQMKVRRWVCCMLFVCVCFSLT